MRERFRADADLRCARRLSHKNCIKFMRLRSFTGKSKSDLSMVVVHGGVVKFISHSEVLSSRGATTATGSSIASRGDESAGEQSLRCESHSSASKSMHLCDVGGVGVGVVVCLSVSDSSNRMNESGQSKPPEAIVASFKATVIRLSVLSF